MVKITIENDGTKTDLAGRCIFVAAIDTEGDSDMATALVGNTSPYDLTDTLGKCIGAQIKEIVPNFADQLRLLDILAKSTARGMFGDVKAVKADIE